MRRVVVQPAAKAELREQLRYISERSPSAAGRLRDAVRSAFEAIRTMPRAGSPRFASEAGLEEVRVWPVRGFPEHQIFYRVTDDAIEIAHFWHAKRDPRGLGRGSEKS